MPSDTGAEIGSSAHGVDATVERSVAESADGTLPTTLMQKHMWAMSQRRDAGAAYNIPIYFEVAGSLDQERLRAAVESLVAMVPALRASFFVDDEGEVRQRIITRREVTLSVVDAACDGDDRRARLAEIVRREVGRSFDLEHDVPLRATLVQAGPDAQLLLITLHHIVGDEESIELIASRLAALYVDDPGVDERIAAEEASRYADYVRRRSAGRGPELERIDLDYWERRLAGMPELHRLPTDAPRGPRQTFRGGIHEHALDDAASLSVRAFCAEHRITLYVFLHSVLALLISRLSGETDIVIGMPVSERHRGPFAESVGCFLNTAMLRSDLSGDQSFSALMHASRTQIAEAMEHDCVSLPELAKRLHFAADIGHSSLFQIMLVQQVSDYLRLPMGEASLVQFYPQEYPAKTDLIMNLCDLGGTIRLRWEYNADLWSAATIVSMAQRFVALLERALAQPRSPISGLFPVTPADLDALRALDGPRIDFGPFVAAHTLFERQARIRPDAIALRHGEVAVRYDALDARADALATRLAERGIGPGSVVAIGVRRGVQMAVAMLGAMKAGATYLPLDPTHPPERLQMMLRDAGAVLTIGEKATASVFASADLPLLDLDASDVDRQAAPLSVHTDPDRDAYIIYTSGSTGTPKGVSDRLPSERPRRWLAVVTLAFDMSLVDLFWPLTRGDTVVIADEQDVADGRRLRAMLAADGIDAMQATPSTWQSLLSAGWQGTPGLLAISGGEALTEPLARALLSRCEEVWNGYGPTEITVYSLLRRVRATDGPVDLLGIGAPLPNAIHRVLDAAMRPVPPGVAGELHIGGPGLARCYMGRADLTDERFAVMPGENPGERLYRTGDLVCLLPSGNMRYLGRVDHQIKLRGYRIELGEIEQAMLAVPGVARAVADIKIWGDTAIVVGFVCLDPSLARGDESIARIRRRLDERLPPYMVPQILLERDAFPLSSNGKIDRKALLRTVERMQGVVALATETERRLAALWEELLGLEGIGADGNFFALGGQSVLITRLLYLIRKEFGVTLRVSWVYEDPTLRGLAEKIDLLQALEESGQAYDGHADYEEIEL
jgi:amino acid adenylation domain-containing protein